MLRSLALVPALALVAACTSQPAAEAPKEPRRLAPFTIAVQGDNRGEIGPCGCTLRQEGGLPRRATALSQAREAGPLLLLDSGDALFPKLGKGGDRDDEKAALILREMAGMGTAAMAVGERDLALGPDWLASRAKEAGLPLLAANLRKEDGTRPFEARKLLEVGEAKVGVFGIFGQHAGVGPLPDVVADDPVVAASAQIEALRAGGADLVVGLVHGPTVLQREIAALPDLDLLIPSHDGSLSLPYQPRPGNAWIVGAGQLGRTLAMIRMNLDGDGALVDEGVAARLREEKDGLSQRLAEAKTIFASSAQAAPEDREAVVVRIRTLEHRLSEVERQVAQVGHAEGRRFRMERIDLVESIPDDPEVAARVDAFTAGR